MMCQVPLPCQSHCLRVVIRASWSSHRAHTHGHCHLLEGQIVYAVHKVLFWTCNEQCGPWRMQCSVLASVHCWHQVKVQTWLYFSLCWKGNAHKIGAGHGEGTSNVSNTLLKKETDMGAGTHPGRSCSCKGSEARASPVCRVVKGSLRHSVCAGISPSMVMRFTVTWGVCSCLCLSL